MQLIERPSRSTLTRISNVRHDNRATLESLSVCTDRTRTEWGLDEVNRPTDSHGRPGRQTSVNLDKLDAKQTYNSRSLMLAAGRRFFSTRRSVEHCRTRMMYSRDVCRLFALTCRRSFARCCRSFALYSRVLYRISCVRRKRGCIPSLPSSLCPFFIHLLCIP